MYPTEALFLSSAYFRGRFRDIAAEGGRTLLIVQVARSLVRQQLFKPRRRFLFCGVKSRRASAPFAGFGVPMPHPARLRQSPTKSLGSPDQSKSSAVSNHPILGRRPRSSHGRPRRRVARGEGLLGGILHSVKAIGRWHDLAPEKNEGLREPPTWMALKAIVPNFCRDVVYGMATSRQLKQRFQSPDQEQYSLDAFRTAEGREGQPPWNAPWETHPARLI
jgi:hypothetical protein